MSLYSFLSTALSPLTKILWPTKIVNRDNFEKIEGGIVMCNHYSKVDAIILTASIFRKDFNAVVKSEAFETSKISNWFLNMIGAIPIRRGQADIKAVKQIMKVLKANKKLLIFPEGTRNKEGSKEMLPFKPGTARFAIKTKKPVLPMIYYKMPKGRTMNYLYIGEPISMEEYYDARTSDEYEKATTFLFDKMCETRVLCDEYVASLKNKKAKK